MTKNKKKNFVFKVCALLVMALLCIVSFVIPTKAYYQDNNGNLVSVNLWPDVNVYETYCNYGYVSFESGTYSIYFHNVNDDNTGGAFVLVNENGVNVVEDYIYNVVSNRFVTFTLNNNTSLRFYCNRGTNNNVWTEESSIMLYKGSSYVSFESYGIYYSQTNYDNYGAIQYGTGYTDGKNSVYDSLTYQNISRLVSSVSLGKYDTANETFINRTNINSFTFEQSDCVVAWSTSSSDVGYWYHLILTWNTNSVVKDVGFTPSYFTNVILDINGYQMSNVNYNGSYFGFFNINEQYNEPCNTITLMFKMNSNVANFENVHVNIQGFNSDIQASSELYNEGYEQGINVGKAEGYSIGYSEGVNQATENVIGWKGLFFSMADLPFKTVSNFLGFEVLGVNLFKAFIGFITVLGILWVFKRLVK